MRDGLKSCLALLAFGAMMVTPVLAGGIGWLASSDWQTGLIAALAGLALFGGLWLMFLAMIKAPALWMALLPYLSAVAYDVIPGVIPTGIDNAVVTVLGGLATFWLLRKRTPRLDAKVLIPLVLSGLYPLVGGFIFGPLDELAVFALAGVFIWRALASAQNGIVLR